MRFFILFLALSVLIGCDQEATTNSDVVPRGVQESSSRDGAEILVKASFDCEKVETKIEEAICADSNLSDLDGKLAQLYRDVLDRHPMKQWVSEQQSTWLKKSRKQCDVLVKLQIGSGDILGTCLSDKYKSQIDYLANLPIYPNFVTQVMNLDHTFDLQPCIGFVRKDLLGSKILKTWCTNQEASDYVSSAALSAEKDNVYPDLKFRKFSEGCEDQADFDCIRLRTDELVQKQYEKLDSELRKMRAFSAIEMGDAKAGKELLDRYSGYYRHYFENQLISGEKYESVDETDIVPINSTAAYVRLHLEFGNGHQCNYAGVMRYASDFSLRSYLPRDSDPNFTCRLRATEVEGCLVFEDADYSCSSWCGVRGSLGGHRVCVKDKKPIESVSNALANEEVHEVVSEYLKDQRH